MSLRIACAIVGGLALAPAFAQAQTYWGSIYSSHTSGTFGSSRAEPTPEAARKSAKHACNRQQHGLCVERITFSNTCASATAQTAFGGLVKNVYAATGENHRQAMRASSKICVDTSKARKRMFSGCKTLVTTCAWPR